MFVYVAMCICLLWNIRAYDAYLFTCGSLKSAEKFNICTCFFDSTTEKILVDCSRSTGLTSVPAFSPKILGRISVVNMTGTDYCRTGVGKSAESFDIVCKGKLIKFKIFKEKFQVYKICLYF